MAQKVCEEGDAARRMRQGSPGETGNPSVTSFHVSNLNARRMASTSGVQSLEVELRLPT